MCGVPQSTRPRHVPAPNGHMWSVSTRPRHVPASNGHMICVHLCGGLAPSRPSFATQRPYVSVCVVALRLLDRISAPNGHAVRCFSCVCFGPPPSVRACFVIFNGHIFSFVSCACRPLARFPASNGHMLLLLSSIVAWFNGIFCAWPTVCRF